MRLTETLTRRQFIERGGKVITASLVLPRVGLQSAEQQWYEDAYWDGSKFKERGNTPQEGDVVMFGERYYLLRNGKKYAMTRQQFAQYRSLSKLDEYGRRTFVNPDRSLLALPDGVASEEQVYIDPFTGEVKWIKRFGGEINIFIPGFFTDGGVVFEWPFSRLFEKVRGENGLKSKKWDELDDFYFTYGAKGIEAHNTQDTARDPVVNMNHALEFIKILKEELPFVQVNIFAHSLGALFALEIAKKHPDVVNNLVLISSPVRGLDENSVAKGPFGIRVRRWFAARVFKEVLRGIGMDEQVIHHLFSRWKDNGHQRQLDLFVEWFRGLGKGLLEFSSPKDQIAPTESTLLQGKPNILRGREIPSTWQMAEPTTQLNPLERTERILKALWDVLASWFTAHWAPTEDPDVISSVTEAFGENRAAA